MVDVSRECCERYFGMDDELFDYTMATLRWLLALCERVAGNRSRNADIWTTRKGLFRQAMTGLWNNGNSMHRQQLRRCP